MWRIPVFVIFLLTGWGLLPAPPSRPPVPDVLRGDPEVQRQWAPLCLLHKRGLLLREGHRPLAGQKEAAGDPRHSGADWGRGAGAGIHIGGRGMKGFLGKNFYSNTRSKSLWHNVYTEDSKISQVAEKWEVSCAFKCRAFTNITKKLLERTVEPYLHKNRLAVTIPAFGTCAKGGWVAYHNMAFKVHS